MTKRKRVVIPAPRLVNSGMASSIVYPPKPHQPRHFSFPKKVWGKAVLRAFQASWFDKWSFLHYDEANGLGSLPYLCTHLQQEHAEVRQCDPAFVSFLSANLLFFPLTIECKAM